MKSLCLDSKDWPGLLLKFLWLGAHIGLVKHEYSLQKVWTNLTSFAKPNNDWRVKKSDNTTRRHKFAKRWNCNQNATTTKQKDIVLQKDDNDLLQEDIYYICFKSPLVLTKNSCYYFVIHLQWFATKTHQSATKETEIVQEHNIDVQFIITHWLATINKGMSQGVIITKVNHHRTILVMKMDLKIKFDNLKNSVMRIDW